MVVRMAVAEVVATAENQLHEDDRLLRLDH